MFASSHDLSLWFGKSAKVLGSEDIRSGAGLSYSSARVEPRFKCAGVRAQLVYEGYVDYTDTAGVIRPRVSSEAAGALAYARWWGRPFKVGPAFYADFGWGLQAATRPTFDLPSDFNSTPMVDIGTAVPAGREQVLLGVRFLHISNAGLATPNRGQDELFLMAGVQW
jgi:hypothetical protein